MKQRSRFFYLVLSVLTGIYSYDLCAATAERESSIVMRGFFFVEIQKLANKKNYLELLKQRENCLDMQVVCKWESIEILRLWLHDEDSEKTSEYGVPRLFNLVRELLDSKEGRKYPFFVLSDAYDEGQFGLRPDPEISDCWFRINLSKGWTTVDECEGLELKKYGIKNPWLLLK